MRWPEEIEADLWVHCSRTDIGWWHRLTIDPNTGAPRLSSRRLLVLLKGLPDKGEFKTALRGGRQTRAERVAEETYNEIARLRASFHAAHGGVDASYEPILLSDPVDEIELAREDEAEQQSTERAVADFEAELGWS